jgi:hypothetical protein
VIHATFDQSVDAQGLGMDPNRWHLLLADLATPRITTVPNKIL